MQDCAGNRQVLRAKRKSHPDGLQAIHLQDMVKTARSPKCLKRSAVVLGGPEQAVDCNAWFSLITRRCCFLLVARTCFDTSCLHVADICHILVQSTSFDQQICAANNSMEACSIWFFLLLWNPELHMEACLTGSSSCVQSYEVAFADGQAKLAQVLAALWRATVCKCVSLFSTT